MEQGARPVRAAVLCAPDGSAGAARTPLDGRPAGYALRRVTLDAALLDHARRHNVEIHEGFAVRQLCRDDREQVTGVSGTNAQGEPQTLRARLVIGADGSHSLVARQLGVVQPIARLQRVAVVAHWCNVAGAQDTIEMRARGALVCGMGFPGGGPDIETGEATANTTFVVPPSQSSQIAGRAGEWVEQTIETCFPDLAKRLAGAQRESRVRTIGCFGHRCASVVADGALLVGDAATFIDPFTGEGVYFCLRGAQLAAETAAAALHRGDTSRSGLRAYAGARRELAQRYLLIDMVQAVVRTPALYGQMVHRLARFPGAAERLFSILGDTRPPAAALHPALLWRLFAPCFGN